MSHARVTVELPAGGWEPRRHQRKLWRYLQNGGRRAAVAWPRRAGKDDVILRQTSIAVMTKAATYWHMLPKSNQVRKAIWDAVNPHSGKRRIDEAFPAEIIEDRRETDMFIRFKNGSTWQCLGSDNYENFIGSPPYGVTFSEYAQADPRAWAFLRMILAENGGWAFFISTPRGRNHYHAMMRVAKDDPAWFHEVLTADDTGTYTPELLASELKEMVAEFGEEEGSALWRQEYYCDFDAPVLGAYYAKLVTQAENEGRVVRLGYDRGAGPCTTAWDLGYSDTMVIWVIQPVGLELRVLDCVHGSGTGMDWYADKLRELGRLYGEHLLPHDAAAHEISSGLTRQKTLHNLGVSPTRIVELHKVADGINAVRRVFPHLVFSQDRCEKGIEALRGYHREYDPERKTFKINPEHDWSSHFADAMRTFAMGYRPVSLISKPAARRSSMLGSTAGY